MGRLKKFEDIEASFQKSLEDIRSKLKRSEKRQSRSLQPTTNTPDPEGLPMFSELTLEDLEDSGIDIPPVPKDGITCFKNFLSTYRFQQIKDKYKKRQGNTSDE